MTIGVYARPTKENNAGYVVQIEEFLRSEGVDLIIYKPFYDYLKDEAGFTTELDTFSSSEELISKAFYLICLGGDGTLLETVTLVRKSGIPVLGVNTGRLGFLSPVNKDDLNDALKMLLNEKFTLDKRELIRVNGCSSLFGNLNYALNECSILKKDAGSMITIDTFVDGIFLHSYFADGLIISTATGSTAYSLSCGGPIMMPDSDNFVITPVASHNLTVRPLVISNNKEISVKVAGRNEEFIVALDSRSVKMPSGAQIRIRKANFRINLVNLEGQHFFNTLRNKLMWGIDKRQ
jgi:NAD+ kinase